MKIIYQQRWSNGKHSNHLSKADIQAFGHEYFQANPTATIEMRGEPKIVILNDSTDLSNFPRYGRWAS